MDQQSIIMGLGILILITAPIIYFQLKHKNEQNKTKRHLEKLGKEKGLTFSTYEFWGSSNAIGLDASQKALCYVTNIYGKEDHALISLADVEKCTIINDHRNVNDNRIIDQIRLSFTFKGSSAHKSLLFYDRETNLNFTNELLLAEKWKNIVCSNTNSNQLAVRC